MKSEVELLHIELSDYCVDLKDLKYTKDESRLAIKNLIKLAAEGLSNEICSSVYDEEEVEKDGPN